MATYLLTYKALAYKVHYRVNELKETNEKEREKKGNSGRYRKKINWMRDEREKEIETEKK